MITEPLRIHRSPSGDRVSLGSTIDVWCRNDPVLNHHSWNAESSRIPDDCFRKRGGGFHKQNSDRPFDLSIECKTSRGQIWEFGLNTPLNISEERTGDGVPPFPESRGRDGGARSG